MKLTIKTKNIEIEYQDDNSSLQNEVNESIQNLIKNMHEYETKLRPVGIVQEYPKPMTWKEALNSKFEYKMF